MMKFRTFMGKVSSNDQALIVAGIMVLLFLTVAWNR